jgi:hypothetical protein
MSVDQSARLRAYELVRNSKSPMTLQEAYEIVYRERYGDDVKAILKALAQLATSSSRALARSTYILSEDDDEQIVLFDIPAVICVNTPDGGPLFIPRDLATGSNVKQWLTEGHRHHSTQKYRFKNGLKDFGLLDESELEQPWSELRLILAERKQNVIEGPE